MQLALVIAVRGLSGRVHDGPVGVVPEEEVGILGQLLHRVQPRRRHEPFRVALALDVALLQRIVAAERHQAAAVQHLAAKVEVLIDDDHRRAEIARANRRRKARAPAADDDDIGLVVPPDGLGRRHLGRCRSRGREHRCRADTGRCARLDEIAPADGLLVLIPAILLNDVPLLGHLFTSREAPLGTGPGRLVARGRRILRLTYPGCHTRTTCPSRARESSVRGWLTAGDELREFRPRERTASMDGRNRGDIQIQPLHVVVERPV